MSDVIEGWRPREWFLEQSWRATAGLSPRYEPNLSRLRVCEDLRSPQCGAVTRETQVAFHEQLRKSEFSSEFVRRVNQCLRRPAIQWYEIYELARRRLVMGFFRHGFFGDPKKPQYDRTADCKRRLQLFHRSGNMEHLVDSFNSLVLEWVEGNHPDRHESPISKPTPLHKVYRRDDWDPRARQAASYVSSYEREHNTEFLIAAAARIVQEFNDGRHPNKHFCATDDAIHARVSHS